MKKLMGVLSVVGFTMLSSSAWADAGPYYVSYPGYCNVKRVYVNAVSDIYGTEIGCSGAIGTPLIGSFTVDGKVAVSTVVNGSPCIAVYGTDGSLGGGCSNGGPIAYVARSTYTVKEAIQGTTSTPQFIVSTEMPDMEKTKNLPSRE